MVQARIHAAQAVAERMHAPQTFLKRHGALHAGTHQLAARFDIGSIGSGAFDMGPCPLQAVEGDAVRRRIKGGGHKGLHAVCHRVHAGCSGQTRWQAQGQLRVADGRLGHQVPAMEAKLAMVIHNDDGTPRHFTAGAARSRYRNQGSDFVGDAGRAALDGGVVG